MIYDLKTANNAKVDFVYAGYGYGNLKTKKKFFKIGKLEDLII